MYENDVCQVDRWRLLDILSLAYGVDRLDDLSSQIERLFQQQNLHGQEVAQFSILTTKELEM